VNNGYLPSSANMSYAIGHARLTQSGVSATAESFSHIVSPVTQELVNIDIIINTNTVYPTGAGKLSYLVRRNMVDQPEKGEAAVMH
jgi:hypothetical protein